MRRLVHISDLHFGRVDATIVKALVACIHRIAPHVTAVSGDLTQRAKPREFAAARAFLDSLPGPKVVVPGNHDVPLYNIAARFLAPLDRYRQYVGDVETSYIDDEIGVVALNTARSSVFKGGRINLEQVQRANRLFCGLGHGQLRVLVTHHPFHLPGKETRHLVGRATMALQQLRKCLPDLLLAGHMHAHGVTTTAERYELGGKSALVVQAGTATSTRARGEENSFNLLCLQRDAVEVTSFEWSRQEGEFVSERARRYVRQGGEWTCEESRPS